MKLLITCGMALVIGSFTGAATAQSSPSVSDPSSPSVSDEECIECHRDPSVAKPGQEQEGEAVDMKAYARSAHADIDCVECHTDARADTHEEGLNSVNCRSCHAKEAALFAVGAHSSEETSVVCVDCHGTHDTLAIEDPDSRVFPLNLGATCGNCHDAEETDAPGDNGGPKFDREIYEKSVHFLGMTDDGLTISATCKDCHGGHDMAPVDETGSLVFRENVPATCGQCHEGMFEDYMAGVHGQALVQGNSDTPVCTDCHGEHGIRDTSDPESSVYATNVSKSTCPQCHSAEHVNRRYGMLANQVEGYRETFHGLADRLGDPTVANCASCHGAHLILHSSHPESSVNQANLAETCGDCHQDAGENFAAGSVHNPEQGSGGAVLGIVKKIYILLIAVTIGGMLAYNGLDYFATMRERWRATRKSRRVSRFTVGERLQHFVLVLTFVILAITGFALRFPESGWVQALTAWGMGFLVRGYLHRVAAILFVAASVYHIFYLFWTTRGKTQGKAMLPNRSDLRQLKHQLRYYVGLEEKPAQFGRYSYVEKVEYLALIWGSIVMVVTGFILWFEVGAMRVIPKWGWDLAELVHYYEAWLATLSILVWHLYHVAFKPSGHGVSLAMFNGELTEAEMKHEHPAELETLPANEILEPQSEKEPHHDEPPLSRPILPAGS